MTTDQWIEVTSTDDYVNLPLDTIIRVVMKDGAPGYRTVGSAEWRKVLLFRVVKMGYVPPLVNEFPGDRAAWAKPRLRRATWRRAQDWQCDCGHAVGHGGTPDEAYANWFDNKRVNLMLRAHCRVVRG